MLGSKIRKQDIFLRRAFLVICDFVSVLFAFWFVNFSLRGIPGGVKALTTPIMLMLTLINVLIYALGGLYSSLWEFTGTREVLQIGFCTLIASGVDLGIGLLMQNRLRYVQYVFVWITLFMFALGIRLSYRFLRFLRDWLSIKTRRDHQRVLIIGADEYGSMLVNKMLDGQLSFGTPIIILDDNSLKWGKRVHGIKVYGGIDKIAKAVRIYSIDEIIIASDNLPFDVTRSIYDAASELGCKVRVTQGIEEMLKNDRPVNVRLRDIDMDDLLGRKEVILNTERIRSFVEDKVVLVTGAGGSIGSEICRQVALYNPAQMVLLDEYENCVFELKNELAKQFSHCMSINVEIGSIQDLRRMERLFKEYRPDVVFHAAAHKHVPLMECNPGEAIKNNVFGTWNVATMADRYGTDRFVLISTDKSVNPTSVMGATKCLAERVVRDLATRSKTCFSAVRFGNVLGSAGSVIPIFRRQLEVGGPVTITDKNMVRYFMTIPEAASLVIEAGSMGEPGAVYILKMGEPVRIMDLAVNMIRFAGLEPYKDIDIVETGLRPGEKLYEEFHCDDEELTATANPDILVCRRKEDTTYDIAAMKEKLEAALDLSDLEIKHVLKEFIPTYSLDEKTLW